MTIQHSALTGGEIHEPKGADTATVDTVYVSDGAGSGSWRKVAADEVTVTDSGSFFSDSDVEAVLQDLGTHYKYMYGVIADVSTASSIIIPIPENCTVQRVTTILGGAIATADDTVTITRGGDSATLGTITVAYSGSAEGDQDENSSLSNNTLTRSTHKYLKIATDGASTNAVTLSVEIKVSVSHGVY